jgi:hypothetical protein
MNSQRAPGASTVYGDRGMDMDGGMLEGGDRERKHSQTPVSPAFPVYFVHHPLRKCYENFAVGEKSR